MCQHITLEPACPHRATAVLFACPLRHSPVSPVYRALHIPRHCQPNALNTLTVRMDRPCPMCAEHRELLLAQQREHQMLLAELERAIRRHEPSLGGRRAERNRRWARMLRAYRVIGLADRRW